MCTWSVLVRDSELTELLKDVYMVVLVRDGELTEQLKGVYSVFLVRDSKLTELLFKRVHKGLFWYVTAS